MYDPPHSNFWLPLDNAAKIYPAIQTRELTAVFRITAVLKDKVNIQALYRALSKLEPRFPYYRMSLKKGFFWYYLEHKDVPIPVVMDDKIPCCGFKSPKSILMRVLVVNKSISVEFSHILTDGGGALSFFKSVLLTYFEQCGIEIPQNFHYHKPGEGVKETEIEDAYQRYFQRKLPEMAKSQPSFHLPFKLKKKPRYDALIVILPLSDIHRAARDFKTSITGYLVSVYLMALQEIYLQLDVKTQRKVNKILRIQVPVNMRTIYPSETMRNFSLFVMPEIDLRLGHYTFEEIIKKVYYLMQLETDKKMISKIISRNVGSEKRPEIRSTPLFLKSLILNFKYKSLGTSLYSGVVTNLGKVDFSPEINALIDYFIFTPPPPNKVLKVNCGMVGFEDNLVMSFGNISKSTDLENSFVGFLKTQGIQAKTFHFNDFR